MSTARHDDWHGYVGPYRLYVFEGEEIGWEWGISGSKEGGIASSFGAAKRAVAEAAVNKLRADLAEAEALQQKFQKEKKA